jgi:hypothetical protein
MENIEMKRDLRMVLFVVAVLMMVLLSVISVAGAASATRESGSTVKTMSSYVADAVAPTRPPDILTLAFLHTCALTAAGAVECWGNNDWNQAGTHAGPYTEVSAGDGHTCALTPAGAIECWGLNESGEGDNHAGPYTDVSVEGLHTCGLTPEGAVECWGWNLDGEIENSDGPYTALDVGYQHNCGLTPAGAVKCWGSNGYGLVGTHAGPYTAFDAGSFHTCAITPAGAVECWGLDLSGETENRAGPYTAVSGGYLYTCALTPAGAVECWGNNDYGQAGTHAGPYTAVSAGDLHTCALTPAGAAECWGWNDDGQAENHAGPYGPYDPPEPSIFMSTTVSGETADGLAFGSEDIIKWDGDEWSMWFDGSAAGLPPNGRGQQNVNALWIPDPDEPDVVLSFGQNSRYVPGITGKVDSMDLVWWDGSAFSLYFDGNDVDLNSKTQEKIDGLHVLPGSASPIGRRCQAYLLISTQGPGRVTGAYGTVIQFGGEDVLGFCLTNAGSATAGFWHLLLDGSAEGMPKNSTDSISLSGDGETLYLTTRGTFNVDGATGGRSMVYTYDLTTKEFDGPFFTAADNGLPKTVDGLQVE